LGRFLSPDTVVPGFANPQNLNRFGYVLNNPVRYVDPSGHVCTDPDDPTPSCSSGNPYPNNTNPLGDAPVVYPPNPLDDGPEVDEVGGNNLSTGDDSSSLDILIEILNDILNPNVVIGPILFPVESPDSIILPALWKPKQRGDDATWNALAWILGIDVRLLRKNVEDCKYSAGIPGGESVEIDDQTGNIIYNGEVIGNAIDGC